MEGTIMDCRCLLKSLLSLMLFVLTAPLALALQSGSASDEINAAPDVRLGPLYAAVQSAGIFPDQKTFADAIPKREPSAIVANWQRQKSLHSFDLALFVQRNFILPGAPSEYLTPTGQSLREHINSLWPILTRHTKTVARWDSLIPLPNPYVVPGGRFREVYYWDSYFTMLGLAESGCWTMVSNMVDNFASLIDRYGFIPNGNRDYYLSRSQPP